MKRFLIFAIVICCLLALSLTVTANYATWVAPVGKMWSGPVSVPGEHVETIPYYSNGVLVDLTIWCIPNDACVCYSLSPNRAVLTTDPGREGVQHPNDPSSFFIVGLTDQ